MPYIEYQRWNPKPETLVVVNHAIRICNAYAAAGIQLNLRGLYYQFVSELLIANTEPDYKRLISIISRARRAGLIDWRHIVDLTRDLERLPAWDDPVGFIDPAQYREDLWRSQPVRIEVWIEKAALVGVIQGVCEELRVPYLACRGNPSDSEVWAAAHDRLVGYLRDGKQVLILYLGDHDPNGLDISRDVGERLRMFIENDPRVPGEYAFGVDFEVRRIALNIDQVRHYNPPPNPAKETDSRFKRYAAQYGLQSWELDALKPEVIIALIRLHIEREINQQQWDADLADEADNRNDLSAVRDQWRGVTRWVKGVRHGNR